MYYKNNVVNDWLVWHLHLSVVIFLKVFKFYLLQKICKGDLTLDPLPQSPLYLPPAILNCEGSCKPFNGLEIWNPRCSLSFPYSAASMDHTDSKWSAQSVWGGCGWGLVWGEPYPMFCANVNKLCLLFYSSQNIMLCFFYYGHPL